MSGRAWVARLRHNIAEDSLDAMHEYSSSDDEPLKLF
jgi:hypothetical protein